MDYRVHVKCKDRLTDNLIEVGTVIKYCDYLNEIGRNWISGYIDDVRVEVCEKFVISVEEEAKSKKDFNYSYEPEYRNWFWHPDRRIFTVEDTQDYNSTEIIKKNTIIEDWCDNGDGTYDVSLDGVECYRISADSIEFMLGG